MTIHVLHVIPSMRKSYGGPSFMLASLADALIDVDIKVTIALPISQADPSQNVLPNSISVKILTIPPSGGKVFLADYCREEKVDIIHNHGLWQKTNHLAVLAAKKSNIPLILTTHGMLRPWAISHKRLKKRVAWWLYQKHDTQFAKVLHSTCQDESSELQALGLGNEISEIPIGINLREIPDTPSQKPTKRKMLFLGRLHPVKGLVDLVNAMDKIRPEEWMCVVAGPSEDGFGKKLKKTVAEKNLESWFDFIGPVNAREKWSLFHDADLFVLPSYTENFGVVVLEALSCEVPVLTTNATPWSILPEAGCGWSISVGETSLTVALKKCLNIEREELRAMGKKGRRLVEKRFTWERIAHQMKDLYGSCRKGDHNVSCRKTFFLKRG